MNYIKIIGVLIGTAIIVFGVLLVFAYIDKDQSLFGEDILVKDYKATVEQPVPAGLKIENFSQGTAVGWVSEREILILKPKVEEKVKLKIVEKEIIRTTGSSIGIYNLDTGELKEFSNIEVGEFISISPNKRYVIFEEPDDNDYSKIVENKSVPDELLNHSIMLLDLLTGKASALNVKYKNKDASYSWTLDNKIIGSYPYENELNIIDVNGRVYKSAKINSNDCINVVGNDVSVNGDEVTGNIYFFMTKTKEPDTWVNRLDVKTGETKKMLYSKEFFEITSQNGVMIKKDFVFINEQECKDTLSLIDKDGNTLKEYVFNNINIRIDYCAVSPDGKKLAMVGMIGHDYWSNEISLLDIKTGESNKILSTGMVEKLEWNTEGNALSITYRPSVEDRLSSQIISFQ